MAGVTQAARRLTRVAGALVPFLIAAHPSVADAQAPGPAPSYVHESWTVREGLPVNIVNDILQGRDGYLWIATSDGLVRFDGVRFTIFNAASSPGLPSSRLVALEHTSDGALWIETEQHHLVRFRRGVFTLIEHRRTPAVLTVLTEDSRKNIWISRDQGLGVIRDSRIVPVAAATVRDRVTAIVPQRDGAVLVATHDAIFRVQGDSATRVIARDRFGGDSIAALLEDRAGTMWVATNNGVWRWRDSVTRVASIRSEGYVTLVEAPRASEVWVGTMNRVSRVDTDSAGGTPRMTDVWVGDRGHSHRLIVADSTGRMHWGAQQRVYADARGSGIDRVRGDTVVVLTGTVSSITFDHEGSIWVGSSIQGLHRLKPSVLRVVSNKPGTQNNNVYPILEARDGTVWYGTAGGDLVHLAAGRTEVFRPKFAGTVSWVRALFEDRAGRLWVGGYGLSVCARPGLRCSPPPGNMPYDAMVGVAAFHEDPDGALWIGSERGLFRTKDGVWTHIVAVDSMPNVPVRGFLRAKDGALWMLTIGSGLFRYESGSFRVITERDGLPSNLIRSLYEDADGWMWVGTEGRGLARLDPREWVPGRTGGRILSIGAKDGLFDDAVHRIIEDDDGRVWLNGNRGVSWVPRRELLAFAEGKLPRVSATSYTERDGMLNREGNGGSAPVGTRMRDGTIWFPTQDGIAVFDPKSIRRNPLPPPVVVEQVTAGDTTVWTGSDTVSLGSARRDLEISYAAMSFVAPANVRFRYRLDPYDPGWIEAGARRTAFYTRVPPGRYTFRVIASNNDGVWNTTGASVAIHVAPRIWETATFRVVMTASLLGIAALGVRMRLRTLRERGAALEALVDERTRTLREREAQLEARNAQLAEHNESRSRLFANLSHEFRTPLTLILGPIRSLLDGRHGPLTPEAREQTELMQRNGQRLLRLINQVLDLARLQAGTVKLDRRPHDLVEFARTTTVAFAPLAERRRIALRFGSLDGASNGQPLHVAFDTEQLEKVLLNLLSNALKFTEPGGSVHVSVGRQGDHAVVVVRDTGVGIAPDQVSRVFERFYQADASTTRRYEGTGIGLALARELVELHGGRISVDSTVGAGSAFRVRIPVTDVVQPDPTHRANGARPLSDTDDHEAALGTPADTPLATTMEHEFVDRTTVLLVDDNADVRAFVRSLLRTDYRVIEAPDGRTGLQMARTELPDLIVADVMMPELDGLALGNALKSDAMTDAIPLVLLSARAATEDQVAGLQTGADAYLLKPFDPPVLLATVGGLLTQRRRLRERFRQGVEPAVAEAAPEQLAKEPPAIDRRLRPLVTARLTDPTLDPNELAAAAGLSYHQLYRALREEMGMSPSRFIRTVRVEAAADLLRRGAGSVAEVAYSVGFESLSYFSRAFQERFDAPPSTFLR